MSFWNSQLEEAGRFAQATIDALSAQLCVLDEAGTILATNEAWRRFAEANPPVAQRADTGDNYLQVCDEARGRHGEEAAEFAAGIRAVLRGERAEFALEYPCHSLTERRWFVGRVTRFAGDGPVRVVVAHENITERKLAAERLEASQKDNAELHAALDEHAIVARTDARGKITFVNDKFCAISKYKREELLGQDHRIINSGHHSKEFMRDLWTTIGAGRVWHGEIKNRAKDGSFYWVATTIVPFLDAHGKPREYVAIRADITERKRAEEELRVMVKENADLRTALDEHAIVARTDARGKITFVNDKFCAISRYAREELLGKDHRIINSGHHSKEFMRDLWTTIGAGRVWHGEIKNRAKDGSFYWVDTTIVPFLDLAGKPRQYVAIRADITERKRTEEELRLFRGLVDQSNDTFEVIDPETSRFLDVNEKGAADLGCTREEYLAQRVIDIDPTMTAEKWAEFLRTIRAAGAVTGQGIHRRKDGSTFPIEFSAKWVRLDREYIVTAVRDITERQRNEERFRRLVDSNAQGVMFRKTNGEITGANEAFLQMVGYTREELEAGALNWIALTPREYADLDRHCLEELAVKGVCAPYEKQYRRKDGSRVPVLVGAAAFEDNPDEGVCFALDLTERKKLEQQFLRAQRMESIGTLAGGIAHDLNNSLGPIIMSLDLLKMKFTDPASQELLAIIGTSAQRGADMVSQVLSFARGVEGRRMEVQVKHLLRDIEKIASDTFPKDIQVRTIVPPELWTVLGDPTQLHQVLLNLCVNARDAMPTGGVLTLSAQDLMLDAHYAAMNPEAQAGPYVFLQVEDSGTGMAPEVMAKIFDPFFTTKELGKGTGLGLSTSLGIVRSHGGFIRAYSELGKGTTFKVYLPAVTESSPAVAAEQAAEMPRGNGELILVVDDEASVRQITQQTLEAFGYRVVLASDGAEAVAIYARQGAEIAAVLTDMMMPIMDGPATIQVLRRMNPQVAIIGASGLSANGHVTRAANLGVKHFLPKPYTAEALLKLLRQAISTAG